MFNGSIAALVTPFDERGGIDPSALDGLVDFHLENGTDGIVVAGTTGESATLNDEEVSAALRQVIRRVDGRLPVLAGTGSCSTAAAVAHTRAAAAEGADAALVVTPYYNRPPQAGLEAHFLAVADASSIPVVLYNVPSRTAVDLLPATAERLAAHPRIVGIKEAVADPARIDELRDRCGTDFCVLSGDDHSCLDAMKHGAAGVISVAANVAPGMMKALCVAARTGSWEEADRIDGRLQPLFAALMTESNPIPVKWALCEMGLIGAGIRLPLRPLDESKRQGLRDVLLDLRLVA